MEAKGEKYEKQDAIVMGTVGAIAIIIVNVMNHFGLLQIFFGTTDTTYATQIITVILIAIGTYILSYTHRKRKEKYIKRMNNSRETTNNINKANENNTGKSSSILNTFHLHTPPIFETTEEKYEKQDAIVTGIVGAIAIIIVNVMNHFGLLQIFFGTTDTTYATQIITVILIAIGTYILSYTHRKRKEKYIKRMNNSRETTNNVNKANENNTGKSSSIL